MDIDLSTFKKKTPTEAWFVFDAAKGMRVKLTYISPEEVRKRVKECTTIEAGKEVFDQEKLLKDLATRIADWEGFSLGRVAELMDIEIPADQAENNVPCTEVNKLTLLKGSWQFKPFIESNTIQLEEFKKAQREAERKNLSPSPNGPSAEGSAARTAGT